MRGGLLRCRAIEAGGCFYLDYSGSLVKLPAMFRIELPHPAALQEELPEAVMVYQ